MKIVINRSDAIGDTLLTIPMANLIKEQQPDATLVFIATPLTAPLFENHPTVDDVWILDPKQGKIRQFSTMMKKMKEFRPDLYIYVGGSHSASLAARMCGVPLRGGLRSRWPSFFTLNKGVRQSRSMVVMHESEYNLNLLRPFGFNYTSEMRSRIGKGLVRFTSGEQEEILGDFRKTLNDEGFEGAKNYIVIHPGMTGHTLNWASRNYGRLISRLDREFPGKFNFVISHTPGDTPFLSGLKDHLSQEEQGKLSKQVFFLDGTKKGLRYSAGVIAGASLFVGPSTGPTHIANALGVPQVGIYSPIKVQSSLRWGPLNNDKSLVRVVVPDVVCGELKVCAGRPCPYYECMGKVEVENVFTQAMDILIKE